MARLRRPFYSDDAITIWHGNALDLPLDDASVDLIVTSPPYFGLRAYADGGETYAGQIGTEATLREFLDALTAATAEMARVLKPSGSIFVNLGDKYSGNGVPGRPKSLLLVPERYRIRCADELGLTPRAVIVWNKLNGLPESVRDRVRRSHEDWVHLVKEPQYFADLDQIREDYSPNKAWGSSAKSGIKAGSATAALRGHRTEQHQAGLTQREDNPLGRIPGSVWSIPIQQLTVPDHLPQHFAAYPMEWPRRIIRGWCPPGGSVLDPFGGTGTTGVVAKALGRGAHLVDLSADYCRLAQWRVTNPGELARAMQVEKPPAEPEDMDSLLDLLEDGAA